jgi:hypothetical protein
MALYKVTITTTVGGAATPTVYSVEASSEAAAVSEARRRSAANPQNRFLPPGAFSEPTVQTYPDEKEWVELGGTASQLEAVKRQSNQQAVEASEQATVEEPVQTVTDSSFSAYADRLGDSVRAAVPGSPGLPPTPEFGNVQNFSQDDSSLPPVSLDDFAVRKFEEDQARAIRVREEEKAAAAAAEAAAAAAAGSLPFDLSDQDLFNISSDAGYKRAFGNVFGNEITSRGPLAGYFDRQRSGLTSAFRSNSLVDYLKDFGLDQGLANAGAGGTLEGPPRHNYASTIGRTPSGAVGAVGPGAVGPGAFDPTAAAAVTNVPNVLQDKFVPQSGSFEDFLRQSQSAPTGLNSAYGQALANYGTLRGVSQPDAPSSLSYLFAPREANDVGQAYNFLQAAQRGKYSPLVSNLFQRPSYEQSFGDYTLDAQNRAKQGQSAQNFLDFAGSRFGL